MLRSCAIVRHIPETTDFKLFDSLIMQKHFAVLCSLYPVGMAT